MVGCYPVLTSCAFTCVVVQEFTKTQNWLLWFCIRPTLFSFYGILERCATCDIQNKAFEKRYSEHYSELLQRIHDIHMVSKRSRHRSFSRVILPGTFIVVRMAGEDLSCSLIVGFFRVFYWSKCGTCMGCRAPCIMFDLYILRISYRLLAYGVLQMLLFLT